MRLNQDNKKIKMNLKIKPLVFSSLTPVSHFLWYSVVRLENRGFIYNWFSFLSVIFKQSHLTQFSFIFIVFKVLNQSFFFRIKGMIKSGRELVEINTFKDEHVTQVAKRVIQEVKERWQEAYSKAFSDLKKIKVIEKMNITQLLSMIDLAE